jgi:hypothetical protein
VRGADVPVRGAAHLTFPLRGLLPLPPEALIDDFYDHIRPFHTFWTREILSLGKADTSAA